MKRIEEKRIGEKVQEMRDRTISLSHEQSHPRPELCSSEKKHCKE